MVTGRGLLTENASGRKLRVWYWNGEDPREEIERRVAAIGLHYGLSADDIGDRLYMNSGRNSPIIMATDTRDGAVVATPLRDALIAEMRARGIDVLILDPFVTTHGVPENDNGKINAVVKAFGEIAEGANAAVELVHHVRKAGNGMGGQDRGVDDARGAGALVAGARSVRVLNPMQAEDAAKLEIAVGKHWRYFRLDRGKANLKPATTVSHWSRLASVCLNNGHGHLAADDVGVVERWHRPNLAALVTEEQLAELRERIERGEGDRRDVQARAWIGKPLAAILGRNPEDGADRKHLSAVIKALIAAGVLVEEEGYDERRKPVAFVRVGAGIAPEKAAPPKVEQGWSKVEQVERSGCPTTTPL